MIQKNEGILVINAGSSSIKFSVFTTNGEDLNLNSRGQVEGINVSPTFVAKDENGKVIEKNQWQNSPEINHTFLMKYLLDWIKTRLNGAPVRAAGHRVVHGGLKFSAPTLLNNEIMTELEKLTPLAPLHQPHNLSAIKALSSAYSDLPQVACFDTAFHRTNPEESQMFFLPREYYDEGIRRYGFHGLSYEYISKAMLKYDASLANKKVIVYHLGSGCSMCAIDQGKSVTTSMGFTALDGIPMGTRPGILDAGVVLHLIQQKGMSAKDLENLFYKKSGLLGFSGVSNDMRVLEESNDPRAKETINDFVYNVTKMSGTLAAAMGGVDALVFTAGIGENSPLIREMITDRLKWLGIEVDKMANKQNKNQIHTSNSKIGVWMIPTNEELMIAEHTLRSLK